jgi:hypothetical protein
MEESVMVENRWWLLIAVACLGAWSAGCSDGGLCAGIECSGRGTCYVEPPGIAICRCDPGYHNDMLVFCDPDDPEDPCRGVTCTGHGTCVRVDGLPTCNCDDGYHPAEEEPTVCVRDARDAVVGEDHAGSEDGGDEAAGEPGDEEGDGSDVEAEAGPVCGNGVVETGENCEPGQSRGCESCGHEDCLPDCSGYGDCTGMGRCNPGEVRPCGDCGTMECSDECAFPIYLCSTGTQTCSVEEVEFCGLCGSPPCFRDCPGERSCVDQGASLGCNWGGCVATGAACGSWHCHI